MNQYDTFNIPPDLIEQIGNDFNEGDVDRTQEIRRYAEEVGQIGQYVVELRTRFFTDDHSVKETDMWKAA